MALIFTETCSTHPERHLRLVVDRPVASRSIRQPLEPAVVGAIAGASLLLFLVLGAFVVIAGRGGLSNVATAAATADRGVATAVADRAAAGGDADSTITVRPGDSVWAIARRIQPSGDVRDLVDRIVELNGGADVVPGQLLVLPG